VQVAVDPSRSDSRDLVGRVARVAGPLALEEEEGAARAVVGLNHRADDAAGVGQDSRHVVRERDNPFALDAEDACDQVRSRLYHVEEGRSSRADLATKWPTWRERVHAREQ
jgi:hypothetical protein